MDPLYKVGDIVLIKSAYDPGCTSRSYRFGFALKMLQQHGGKIYKIVHIRRFANKDHDGVPDDGYLYALEGKANCFYWVSSMFEPEF